MGPIGVDIGSQSIRALQLRPSGGQYEIVAAGKVDLESGAVSQQDTVADGLSRLLGKTRFSGKCVATCVPSAIVEMKNIRLPNMPHSELESAAEFEARERFGYSGQDTVIRCIPAGVIPGTGEPQQEVMVMTASAAAIEERLRLLSSLHLDVVRMDLAVNSFFRPFECFLHRSTDAERTGAYVDIGFLGSRIFITRGQDVVFIKTCPVSGQMFDEIAAGVLSLPVEKAAAERRRLMSGDVSGPADGDALSEIIKALQPAIEQLGKEVSLCLRYYAVTFRGERPDSLICGGTESGCPKVLEYISQVTDMTASASAIGQRLLTARSLTNDKLNVTTPEWTMAFGLSLIGIEAVDKEVKAA